ncbi:MAG: hypothetical protein JHC95_12250 [Solirubrobacteraceae bacterium]|nr:hypothetical protein [Solirubrobacteraceae bacterium]
MHDNAVDTLAVLRREQTETDRSKAAPLLKAIGDQVDGVQTAGIRSLSPGWALVPVKRVYTGPDQVSNDELCITNGALIACAPAAATNATGVALITANPKATKFRGLVPDKVTSVRFVPADGRKPTMGAVTSNFYSLMVAGGADPGRVKAPPGYKGGDTIPGPPMPLQGRIEWLNESGEAVGPTSGAPTGRMRQPGGQLR